MKKTIFATLFVLVLLLSACSPSSPSPSSSGSATQNVPVTGNEVKVNIQNFAFDPVTVNVKVGQTVTWTNQDNTPHTVTADDKSFASKPLSTGESFSQTFTTAGTFAYHCSIHPNMKATVIVGP